jgi:predicted HAD superfamily Cof-like phosphohydrolase
MTDIFDLQTEFMAKAGQVVSGNNFSQAMLYSDLVVEEFNEFDDCKNHDFEAVKEACDVLVVASGYLVSLLGTDKAKRAYDLVHASNMAKLEGKIEKREDGKVLKNDLFKNEIKAKLMADLVDLVGGS